MPAAKTLWRVVPAVLSVALASSALKAQTTLPLIQLSNLVYQGAFRLPAGTVGGSEFGYGGTGLAYNPARNSLFMVGNAQKQLVAEVGIPAIRQASTVSTLATATVLQPFADLFEGRIGSINPSDPNAKWVGGLLAHQGKLIASAFSYYDGSKTQVLSHFVSGTTIASPGDLKGPYQVGAVGAGFVSGYMGDVPANLQSMLGGPVVTGNCCISIITRTSYGPSLFSMNPADLGVKNPVPATPLVYYPSTNFVNDWNVQSTFFNGATWIRGVVIPEGTRSVLFFGRQGLGPFCYGLGADCGDPTDQYKGTHSYPYSSYVWAYDALDLAAVKAGQKKPWDVRPYGQWKLSLPFTGDGSGAINGATVDRATGRIYITQAFADGSVPVVHVFTISNAPTGTAPHSPTNVRIGR